MIKVALSETDMKRTDHIGRLRYGHALAARANKGPAFGYGKVPGVTTHINGARGELAFCRALGFTWDEDVDTFRGKPDVLPNWEIRESPDARRLKVRASDPPERLVALVHRLDPPWFEIIGYVVAGWAQANWPARDWGGRGRNAHWVPLHQLAPITPDFHATHGWTRVNGIWCCAFCPARFEEAA